MSPGRNVFGRFLVPVLLGLLPVAVACAARADEPFTRSLSPAEFSQAGLGKLTPEEVGRLDALVQARVAAQLQAQAQTQGQTQAQPQIQVPGQGSSPGQPPSSATYTVVTSASQAPAPTAAAADEQARKAEVETRARTGSVLLNRIETVFLKPGTHIEYSTLDSALVPGFHGWHKGTVLTLANGQRWKVADAGNYFTAKVDHPVKVRIVPGAFGSFFMEIDGGGRPRVKFLDDLAPAGP